MKKLVVMMAAAAAVASTGADAGQGTRHRHKVRSGSAAYWAAALPVNANSSWAEIYRAGLRPAFPQILFERTGNLVPVKNICVSGDNLYAGSDSRCINYTTGSVGACAESASYDLVTPRRYLQELVRLENVNGSQERVVVGTVPAEHALSYNVPVLVDTPTGGEDFGGNSINSEVVFTKAYVIPACEQQPPLPPVQPPVPPQPPGRGH